MFFGSKTAKPFGSARPAARHRPGQLRQRLQGTMIRQEPVANQAVEPRAPRESPSRPGHQAAQPTAEAPRTLWDRQPPLISLQPQILTPEQLAIAHLQRRPQVSNLGERLSILLPNSSCRRGQSPAEIQERPWSLPQPVTRTSQPSPVQPAQPAQPMVLLPQDTPEKVNKLSRRLGALLGEPAQPSAHELHKGAISSHQMLQ